MAGLCEPFVGWMIELNPFAASSGVESVAVVFPIVAAFAVCSALLGLVIQR